MSADELRVRLDRVADAEHELRGPATVLALLCARMLADASCRAYGQALDAQLARLGMALEDLAAARHGRAAPERPCAQELRPLAESTLAGWGAGTADWRAGGARVSADRGRLAQALGNLVANAHEHGDGEVELRGLVSEGALRVEVRNRPGASRGLRAGRGRGLRIAGRAARAAGGRLELSEDGGQVVAALELPLSAAEEAAASLPDAA
jgi:signal transduction histidine kinase